MNFSERKLLVGDFLVNTRGQFAIVAQVTIVECAVIHKENDDIEMIMFEDETWSLNNDFNKLNGDMLVRYCELAKKVMQHLDYIRWADDE